MPKAFDSHNRWWGLKPLFLTGNQTPPARFEGEEHFQAFIDAKEYRAVIGVAGLEVSFNEEGCSSNNAPFGERTQGGYTPFRLTIGNESTSVSFRHYSSGEISGASSIAGGGESAPLGISLDFRIGKLGNAMSRLLVGHFAPYAWMDISYEVFADGQYEVTFSGTYIPSQAYYVDWEKVAEHHLEDVSGEHLDDFLTSQTRNSTPRSEARYVHRGHLKAIQGLTGG